MKYKIFTFFIISLLTGGAFAQNNTNVFLIGHSQTNFTMPRYMASLAKQAGLDYTYQVQIINGSPLKYQWENSATAQGTDGRVELPKGAFDVLFLNDNRPFQSAQAEANSVTYGNLWWDLALSKPAVRVILQPYWPWKTNDIYYADPDPSWEQIIADRRVIYERIAVAMEREHPGRKVYISPIDMAVVNLVRKVERGEVAPYTSRDDIYGDEVHLTDVGKYLNALVNYAVTYRRSPVGLPGKMYNEWGSLMIEIPASAARIFQEVAWQACLDWSRSGVTEETQPPTAPTNLVSTGKTANAVSLSWAASTDNLRLTGYDIYQGTNRVGSSTSTSYTATGLTGSTGYTFKVVAKDAGGNVSAASNPVSVTTNAVSGDPAPTAPTNLVATGKTTNSVSLSWTASTDNTGVTGYDVYRGTALAGSTASATSFTAAGLSPGTSYTFTVKAKDGAGNVSAASNALTVTTTADDLVAPSTPANLTSTGKTSGTVSLAWNASTDNVGVAGYNVYRGSTLEGTTASTSYVALGLASGTAYAFTVRAKDAAGNLSPASNPVTVTTHSAVTYEAENATLSGAAVAGNYAGYTGTGYVDFGSASGQSIQWTVSAAAAGPHSFEVRYANGGTANRPLAVVVNGTTTNAGLAFNPTGAWTSWASTGFTANLNAGNNTVRIVMTQTAGPNVDHLKVAEAGEIDDPVPPTTPTNLIATGKTTESVSLSWGGASDNVSIAGYNIYRGTTLAGTSQATSYTATGLAAGTSYTFTVKAKDPSGNLSAASNALTVTTQASGTGSVTYEAENATLSGAAVATNNAGYTGTGFVDFGSAAGQYVQWSVSAASAGTHTFEIRYANGGPTSRPLSVSVNGTTVDASLDFPPTGGWSTWSAVSFTANLNAGSNTVSVTLTQSAGPNLDHLKVAAGTSAALRIGNSVNGMTPGETAASSAQTVSVHPNPATEYVTVQFSARKAQLVKYRLLNLMSQPALSGNQYVEAGSNAVSIRVSAVNGGMYLLSLDIDGKKSVKKVIIRK